MGRFRTSGLITSISGSVGDVTFSNWKGVGKISKKVKKAGGANTIRRKRSREIFTYLSQSWRGMSFRDWVLWDDYAKQHSSGREKRRGMLISVRGGRMSGLNAYMSVNGLLMSCGFSPISKPCLSIVKSLPLVKSDLLDLGVYNKEVRFNVWLEADYIANCVAQIWLRKVGREDYAYVEAVVPLSTSKREVVIDKIRIRAGRRVLEKSLASTGGCKLYIQMRTVAANGEFSMSSHIYRIEVNV